MFSDNTGPEICRPSRVKTWTSEASSMALLTLAPIVLPSAVSTDADAKEDEERLKLRFPPLPEAKAPNSDKLISSPVEASVPTITPRFIKSAI